MTEAEAAAGALAVSTDNLIIFAILFGALLLFVSERLRVDVVALLVLVSLLLTGLLTVEEAFSGFSSPAVITVWAVFIVSGAVTRSGIGDLLAQLLFRLAGDSPARLTLVVMLTVGLISAFMNNIGAVAILLPAVISVSRQADLPPSKLLIPLSFASLLGGNMTLIGTPPNILASAILESYGDIQPFRFFDFLPTGLLMLGTGALYMVVVGRHILPARSPSSDPRQAHRLRPYLSEVRVTERSPLVGRPLPDAPFGEHYDLNIIHVRREGEEPFFPASDRTLDAGDVLLVEGRPDDLIAAGAVFDLVPAPGAHAAELELALVEAGGRLVEVALAPGSPVVGRTLKEMDFRNRFGLTVLAIRHDGRSLLSHLADVPLRFGDALLVQGTEQRINRLRAEPEFLLLDSPPWQLRRPHKAPMTLAILLGVLLVVTAGWLHVSAAMVIGALALVLGGALTMDEAYEAIEWRSVFLIAGMLPLGIAMETTGTAALIADQIVALVGGLGPRAVLMGIFILTALLTEVISNAAATVLVVPIAIDAAFGLGLSPHTFVMGVVLAASTSFLMPIGHQVNVLVFGPGGYQFADYTRVGIGLNLLIAVVVALTLPLIWPL